MQMNSNGVDFKDDDAFAKFLEVIFNILTVFIYIGFQYYTGFFQSENNKLEFGGNINKKKYSTNDKPSSSKTSGGNGIYLILVLITFQIFPRFDNSTKVYFIFVCIVIFEKQTIDNDDYMDDDRFEKFLEVLFITLKIEK